MALAAGGAVHRCADRARRLALARRLRVDRGHGGCGDGAGCRSHCRAVPRARRRSARGLWRRSSRRSSARRLSSACKSSAILSYGTISRAALLQSKTLLALAPGLDSMLWWPARAALGEVLPLAGRARHELCCCLPPPSLRRAALRRLCDHRRRRRQRQQSVAPRRNGFPQKASPRRCTAPQGMDAAAARSVADVADADADALSAAAGVDAVAQLRPGQQRAPASRAGAGHGGGTACRRARLARDLRRRRARSRRHRAGARRVSFCARRSRRCSAPSPSCLRRWWRRLPSPRRGTR